MADHRGETVLEEYEARQTMREPADVGERFAQQAIRGAHQAAMERAIDGRDKSEYEAFGRLRLKELEFVRRHEVAHEEAAAHSGTREGRFKPVSAQAAAALRTGPEAAEVRRSQRADPAHRRHARLGLIFSCTSQ